MDHLGLQDNVVNQDHQDLPEELVQQDLLDPQVSGVKQANGAMLVQGASPEPLEALVHEERRDHQDHKDNVVILANQGQLVLLEHLEREERLDHKDQQVKSINRANVTHVILHSSMQEKILLFVFYRTTWTCWTSWILRSIWTCWTCRTTGRERRVRPCWSER